MESKALNVLSLFDGMSCGRIALDRLGANVGKYIASEIDKYAIQVSKNNWDDIQHIGNVINVKGNTLPKIDLLIGGSPCQSFSFAGKMAGMSTKDNIEVVTLDQYLKLKEEGFEFEGESYLFWEYVRLLKETSPKYFLLENVKMKSKWEKIISTALGVQPIKINSSLVSAQSRQRLYWTNIQNVVEPEDRNILLKDILECGFTDRDKSHCIDANYFKGGNLKSYFEKHRRQLVFSGNILGLKDINTREDISWRKLLPIECERLQTVPDNYTAGVSNTQRYKMLGNGWTADAIAHILSFIPELK